MDAGSIFPYIGTESSGVDVDLVDFTAGASDRATPERPSGLVW
jgi:hypothetical protein